MLLSLTARAVRQCVHACHLHTCTQNKACKPVAVRAAAPAAVMVEKPAATNSGTHAERRQGLDGTPNQGKVVRRTFRFRFRDFARESLRISQKCMKLIHQHSKLRPGREAGRNATQARIDRDGADPGGETGMHTRPDSGRDRCDGCAGADSWHARLHVRPSLRARTRAQLRPVVTGCEAAVQGPTVPAIRIGGGWCVQLLSYGLGGAPTDAFDRDARAARRHFGARLPTPRLWP